MTIRTETGITQSAARAIRQSKTKSPAAIRIVEINEPNSPGIKCEVLFSITSQSDIIVLVRSARSLLPKNDRGSLRSLSAKLSLLFPLSS